MLKTAEIKNFVRIKIIRFWEDLDRKYNEGERLWVEEANFESDFFFNGLYHLAKDHCKVLEKRPKI